MEFPKNQKGPKAEKQGSLVEDPATLDKPKKQEKQGDREPRKPKGPRKPRENKNGEENPRKPREKPSRFQYPENWKEEIDANTNIETKIPPMPKGEEIVPKPDFDQLRKTQTDSQNKIEKLFKSIDELKAQQKKLKEEAYAKNTSVFAELKEKKAARQQLSESLKAVKEQKQKLLNDIEAVNDKILKLQKKAYGGKIMDKAELDKMIKQKEAAYKNKQHTAAEEKKHIEEMAELKVSLPLISEHDVLKKEREGLEQKLKVVKGESKTLFDKVQDISGAINAIKAKLDAQEATKKPEEQQQTGENKEKEKPKREMTAAEKEIRAKIDKLFEDVDKLRAKKKEISKKFDDDMLAFEKQQFEIKKIDRMIKIQKKIKYDESKKQREAEDAKYKKEVEDKAKDLLQFKYRQEIEACENLVRILQEQKPENRLIQAFEQTAPIEYKVDDKMLKDEGLKLIGRKKGEEEGVKPGQKKLSSKKKSQKSPEAKEDIRLFLDVTTLQGFTELKVMPPTSMTQIDQAIGQLKDKMAYFLKLREDEMNRAPTAKEGEAKEGAEGKAVESPEQNEKKARAEARQEGKKKIEMNEADFPSLS